MGWFKKTTNEKDYRPVLISATWSILGVPASERESQQVATISEIDPVPQYIYTKSGTQKYPGIKRMEFALIPSVDEDGNVRRVSVRKFYLDNLINSTAAQLHITPKDFVWSIAKSKRVVSIGAIIVSEPWIGWKSDEMPNAVKYLCVPNDYSCGLPKATNSEYRACNIETYVDAESISLINSFEMTIIQCIDNNLDKLPENMRKDCIEYFLKPKIKKIISKMGNGNIKSLYPPGLMPKEQMEKPHYTCVMYTPEELRNI